MPKTSITILPLLLLLVNNFCCSTPATVSAANANPNYLNNLQTSLNSLEVSIAQAKTIPPVSQLVDDLWARVEQFWKQKTDKTELFLPLPEDNQVQSNVYLQSRIYSDQFKAEDGSILESENLGSGEPATMLRSQSFGNGVIDYVYKVTPHKVTGDGRLVLSVVDMTFKPMLWHEDEKSEYAVLSPVLAYFWTISGETFGQSSHSVQFNRKLFNKQLDDDKELLCLVWNAKTEKWETFKHFRLSSVDQSWVNCESYDPSEKSKPMAVGYVRPIPKQESYVLSRENTLLEPLSNDVNVPKTAAQFQPEPIEVTNQKDSTNCLGRIPRRELKPKGPLFTIITREMKETISEDAILVTNIKDLKLKTLRYELGEHSEVFGAKIAASSFNHNVGREGLTFPAVDGTKRPNLRMSRDFLKQFMYLKNLEIGVCITDREAADFSKSLGNLESVASSIVTVTFVAPEDNHAISPMVPPIEIEIPLTKSQRVYSPQCYSLDAFNRLENSKCDARLEAGSLICKCTGVASFVVVDTAPRGNQNEGILVENTTPFEKSMRSGDDVMESIAMQQVSSLDDKAHSPNSSIVMLICFIPFVVFLSILAYKHFFCPRRYVQTNSEISRLSGHCYANIVLMAFAAFLILTLAANEIGPVNGKFAETLASLVIVSISVCLGLWKLVLQDAFTSRKLIFYTCIYLPVCLSAIVASLSLLNSSNENSLIDTLGDIVVYTCTSVLGAVLFLDFLVGWSRQNQTPNIAIFQSNTHSPDAASTSMNGSVDNSAAFVTKTSTRVLFVVTAISVALSSALACVNVKTSNSMDLVIVATLFLTCLFGYFLFRSVLGLSNYCIGRHSSLASWSWCVDNVAPNNDVQEMNSKTSEKRRGSKEKGAGDLPPPDYTEEAHGSGESLSHDDDVEVGEEVDGDSFNDDGIILTPHNSRTSHV